VLRTGSTPLTGPDGAGRARRHLRALGLTGLVLLATPLLGAGLRPAGADQVSDLQARAATIAHDLVLEQLRVDAARQQSSVATAQEAADRQAIAGLDRQLAADQQAIAGHLRLVQSQAIRTYVDSGADSSAGDASLFAGGTASAQAASEYEGLAVGTITTDLAQLHTAQRALQVQESALQERQAQDRAAASLRSTALAQATAAAGQLTTEQSLVTGQLAGAVAAQRAAQDRAAAAAVASAPRVDSVTTPPATIPATTTTPSGPRAPAVTVTTTPPAPVGTDGDPYPALADPALNVFLTCVVQAESGGDYGVVSPNGLYMGAFQFSQSTWDTAARAAGLGLLVGVPPNLATRPEQDTVAVTLFALDGQQPWLGDRCS
jgi:hypothetical protein